MMRVWWWPIVLGLLSALGLASGLVSDGLGDVLAWIGLGVPVTTGLYFSLRGRNRRASLRRAHARPSR